MPTPKRDHRPIEVMHCGECNHVLKVHVTYKDECSCVNKHCPQYSARWPLPKRYQVLEAA